MRKQKPMANPVVPTEMESREVREGTEKLRHSDDDLWPRLRELLAEKGLDPNDLAVVMLWPEDGAVLAGHVLHRSGRVFFFEFSYADRDHHGDFLRKWEARSNFDPGPWKGSFAAARELLAEKA